MATKMLNKNIEEAMAAKAVQAGASFKLKHLQTKGKQALKAAKQKVVMKEVKSSMRKNVAAAEKRLQAAKNGKSVY